MAIEKTVRLNAIEFGEDGTLFFRLKKTITVDGEILQERWHRSGIAPGMEPNMQIGLVNTHLAHDGFDTISEADSETLRSQCAAMHTPAVVSAYEAREASRTME